MATRATVSSVPSSSNAPEAPILTKPQAIETASEKAALSRLAITGVSDIRNQQAMLMTMGEYWALGQYDEVIFGSADWFPESGLPVWVVLMEGDAKSSLPASSPSTPTRYNRFVVVLNAHTGYEIGFSPLSAPDQLLAEAQGLDPAYYARYPMEAALEYIKDTIDFPVSEPNFLPSGFSLERVTLELAHPLQDVLPYPKERRQTALQHYSDGQGSTIQLAQFSGELPNPIEGADLVAFQNAKVWTGSEAGGSTWLAWTWVFPESGAYVTNILYSLDAPVSLDTLHEIAASMPEGQPPPPTPEPMRVPTAQLTPTLPSAPLNSATGCSEREEAPPCGRGVAIGMPYAYTLYTHCGVRRAYLDGRRWIADPLLSDGNLNPPPGWANPFDTGTIVLVRDGLARYSNDAGLVAEFRPLRDGKEYPWGPCY